MLRRRGFGLPRVLTCLPDAAALPQIPQPVYSAPVLLALALAPTITFRGLLAEMGDRDALARLPSYECHQASSYNRESVSRNKPGWFADSDGTGFIRKEDHDGKPEWVMMEHDGPGCITKMWTPFFYYDFNNRVGPNIRIYLDGAKEPVIDESYIKLVMGKGSIPSSLAWFTARAGDSYLPIPFAKSAKVTMTAPPFYHLINYRTYPKGTSVESFQPSMLTKEGAAIASTYESLKRSPSTEPLQNREVAPAKSWSFSAKGPGAIQSLKFSIPEVVKDPTLLRSLFLKIKFDAEETVWCPLGDFFHSANALHPIETWTRTTDSDGTLTASWTMPYAKSVRVELFNGSTKTISISAGVKVKPWKWDSRSMHFHARWRPDDIVPGSPFQDWNFIDISGQGVYIGDAWTVLNIRKDSWWGEGDEKIYVDGA